MNGTEPRPSGRARINLLARSLENSLQLIRGQKKLSANENRIELAFEVIENYEHLSGEVYRLRAAQMKRDAQPSHSLKEAEELLSETVAEILQVTKKKSEDSSAYARFIADYRSIWRNHLGLFLFATAFFLASCLLGWNIGVNEPDYVALIAGQNMMEMIHDHHAWFEKINEGPLIEGLTIAWNNIRVALTAFTLGALLGLGGLLILGYNGLLLGCIFGYCHAHGFDDSLMAFVASHGPLEMTIIVASTFSGLLIGRVFYARPLAKMRERLAFASREAATVTLGVVPWLILAASFESFVSPNANIPYSLKVFMGLVLATLFWFWTFSPLKPSAMTAAVRKDDQWSSSNVRH